MRERIGVDDLTVAALHKWGDGELVAGERLGSEE